MMTMPMPSLPSEIREMPDDDTREPFIDVDMRADERADERAEMRDTSDEAREGVIDSDC